jgi:hypothetical protein
MGVDPEYMKPLAFGILYKYLAILLYLAGFLSLMLQSYVTGILLIAVAAVVLGASIICDIKFLIKYFKR